jgi:hypothetical protein
LKKWRDPTYSYSCSLFYSNISPSKGHSMVSRHNLQEHSGFSLSCSSTYLPYSCFSVCLFFVAQSLSHLLKACFRYVVVISSWVISCCNLILLISWTNESLNILIGFDYLMMQYKMSGIESFFPFWFA